MDGSCNGLQNLSALLRDPVGGGATNLTVSPTMQDIYMLVARAAEVRLRAGELTPITLKWLAHGVERSAVKRTVMTTPYGVTRRTSTDYVLSDYLREHPTLFPQEQRYEAAKALMDAVWPAIGDVIVKGREAMEWLARGAGRVTHLDEPDGVVTWVSPSGFPAGQAYFDRAETRVRTRICGQDRRLLVVTEQPEANKSRHRTAMAPNFVHSLDAAHLHRVAAELGRLGVTHVAMIHDDYGTHAAHSDTMYRVIREQFVAMYSDHDPVTELGNRYPEFGEPPSKGTLDIREVLRSEFFFS
jgi:DNA-directed RNA polymerase